MSALMDNYARFPVEFVRGEGARLWDADGEEYLDFLAGISVCNTGHCHPDVVAAIRAQAGQLIHVSNLFMTRPMADLAERLSASSLGGKVLFGNSGRGGERGGAEGRPQGEAGRRHRRRSTAPSTAAPTARSPPRPRSPSRRRSRRWCRASSPSHPTRRRCSPR